jgi:hypothetical protein
VALAVLGAVSSGRRRAARFARFRALANPAHRRSFTWSPAFASLVLYSRARPEPRFCSRSEGNRRYSAPAPYRNCISPARA